VCQLSEREQLRKLRSYGREIPATTELQDPCLCIIGTDRATGDYVTVWVKKAELLDIASRRGGDTS